MSRQLDVKREQREDQRRDALVKALEFGLVGALESQGIDLRGFSIKYEAFNCLLTLRADRNGKWIIAHIGSDTMVNAILRAESDALHQALRWADDKYQPKVT